MKSTVIQVCTAATILLSASVTAQVCKTDTIELRNDPHQYIDHKDGTVTDAITGLTWSKCSIGQRWTESGCSGVAANLAWADALTTVRQFNEIGGLAGQVDWRLPNIKELASLVEPQCHSPAIHLTVFPDTPSATYWSSTAKSDAAGNALGGYSINFATGSDLSPEVTTMRHVRIVRDDN